MRAENENGARQDDDDGPVRGQEIVTGGVHGN